jgi:hypothetical protein
LVLAAGSKIQTPSFFYSGGEACWQQVPEEIDLSVPVSACHANAALPRYNHVTVVREMTSPFSFFSLPLKLTMARLLCS